MLIKSVKIIAHTLTGGIKVSLFCEHGDLENDDGLFTEIMQGKYDNYDNDIEVRVPDMPNTVKVHPDTLRLKSIEDLSSNWETLVKLKVAESKDVNYADVVVNLFKEINELAKEDK